jgi:hypothetical protein
MKYRLLWVCEIKRLLGGKANLVIIALFFCAKFALSWWSATPSDDVLYREYMTRFSGVYTAEKEAKLRAEQMRLSTVFDMRAQMYEAYMQDRISREEYAAYTEEYADAEMRLEILPEVLSHMEYLKNRETEAQILRSQKEAAEWARDEKTSRLTTLRLRGYERPAEMFYQVGWERYVQRNRFDVLLYTLILILLVSYFAKDYETGMAALINTSKYGALVKSLRTFLSLFLCIGLVVVFRVLECVIYAARIGLPNGAVPIQSLAVFSLYAGVMDLQTMLWISPTFQILGTTALVLIIYGLVEALKSTVFVTLCYFLLVFFPYLDRVTLHLIPDAAQRFLFPSVLSGLTVFAEADVMVMMDVPMSNPVVSGVFFLVLCAGASWGLRRHSKK